MYYYRMWICLSETTYESDKGSLHPKAERLREIASEHISPIGKMFIGEINYEMIFFAAFGANHRGDNHEKLIHILNTIVDTMPGSHGLVYWRDDESKVTRELNNYNVYVIKRGEIHTVDDPWLSPINLEIED